MMPSAHIAAFMKGYETLAKVGKDGRIYAYLPTPNDRWTIGYGETSGITSKTVWTREQAEANFTQRLARLGGQVLTLLASAKTTQAQFDAMVSLADNIGLDAFRDSTVLREHRQGRYERAAAAFAMWNKQRNKKTGVLEVLDGLTRRRAAEAAIYRGG